MAHVQRFAELCRLKYKEQAIWFLNGFWAGGMSENANAVWDFVEHFVLLDSQQTPPKGAAGNELDQFWSAKFLEDKDSAMPALQRKEALKSIDQDSNGKMAALEYLTWKYKKSVKDVVEAPQGSNEEAIQAAQKKMDEVMEALKEVDEAIEAVKLANAAVLKAEADLKAAEAELKAEEDRYSSKIADCEKRSQEGGVVSRNKAANELAQLKAEDPLPLRKAKLTNEAALRQVAKETKSAHAAIEEGESKKQVLEQKLDAAQAELEEIKKQGGVAYGALYWMEHELFIADNSLAKAKQKYDHSKPFQFSP